MKKWLLLLLVLSLSGLVWAAPVTIQVLTADGVAIPASIAVGEEEALWSWDGERVVDLDAGTYTITAHFHGEGLSKEIEVGEKPLVVELNSSRTSLMATEFDGRMDDWFEESGGELAYFEDDRLVIEEGTAWFWAGDEAWEDYVYSITFTITNPLSNYYYVRIPFRAEGPYFMNELWLEHRYILLRRYDGSADDRADLVWSWSHRVTHDVQYTVEIAVRGERYIGYLNGVQIFDVEDYETFYFEGMVGLRTSHVGVEVDRAVVVEL